MIMTYCTFIGKSKDFRKFLKGNMCLLEMAEAMSERKLTGKDVLEGNKLIPKTIVKKDNYKNTIGI